MSLIRCAAASSVLPLAGVAPGTGGCTRTPGPGSGAGIIDVGGVGAAHRGNSVRIVTLARSKTGDGLEKNWGVTEFYFVGTFKKIKRMQIYILTLFHTQSKKIKPML